MFNETSYPTCGLGDAASIQRKLDKGKTVNPKKLARFGFTGGDPVVPVTPGGGSGKPITFLPKPGEITHCSGPGGYGPCPPAATGEGTMVGTEGEGGGGFDLSSITDSVGGIFSAIPIWGWAIVAYFVFFRKRR